MTDTAARVLTLLSLLQTPREWPGSELADRLEVSLRTVRRDVERLRELGYPVQATRGALGGYRLVSGTAMPPLLLDDDEAVAVAIGLRAAAAQAVDGLDEASVRALAKLEQVLPSRLRRRVTSVSAATLIVSGDTAAQIDIETLTALSAAIVNREQIRFRYSAADGADSARRVDPHRLVAAGRRWYLVAHDHDRHDWRLFRVDRLHGVQPTSVPIASRELPANDAGEFVTQRLHSLAPTYQALATVAAPAEELRRQLGTAAADIEAIDNHHSKLRTRPDTLDWLAIHLLLLGRAFKVHDPPELVAHLRTLASRAAHATRNKHLSATSKL